MGPKQNEMVRALLVPILIFGGLLLLALVVLLFGDRLGGGDGASGVDERRISEQLQQRFREEYDRLGVAVGSPDAPVVVREFADYQCPACASFAPTAERLREEYVDSGQVRFIFFDFPLPMHQYASEAAAAARCAARGNAFWAYHDRLFATQSDWSRGGDPTDFFLDLAVQTGVPLEPFRRCLTQGATDTLVADNIEVARDVGVMATPTILVGDRVFSGGTRYDTLTAEIENQLAGAQSNE